MMQRIVKEETSMRNNREALPFEVVEDGGGGLHMAVFDRSMNLIFYAHSQELNPDLATDVDTLLQGGSPVDWESNVDREDMARYYLEVSGLVVASHRGIRPDLMGAAARHAFGVTEEY